MFSRRRLKIAFAWTLVLTWAGIIWVLGSDYFSARETHSWLGRTINLLFTDLDHKTRWQIHMGIRKSAHVIEYGILALLTFRAAWISALRNAWASAAWVTLSVVALLACADETRQAFSPTRTGSPFDVLLDLSGGAIGVLVLIVISRRIRGGAGDGALRRRPPASAQKLL
jgi:VanZ family protein